MKQNNLSLGWFIYLFHIQNGSKLGILRVDKLRLRIHGLSIRSIGNNSNNNTIIKIIIIIIIIIMNNNDNDKIIIIIIIYQ